MEYEFCQQFPVGINLNMKCSIFLKDPLTCKEGEAILQRSSKNFLLYQNQIPFSLYQVTISCKK